VVESDRGALAVAWPAPGGRALAFRFDLTDTDLPLRVTFPVLVADAVDWLTEGAEQDGVLAAGRPRELVTAGVDRATLVLPSGDRRELQSRGGALALPALPQPGLLAIIPDGETATPRLLACALLSPEESDLRARGIDGLKDRAPAMAVRGTTVPGRRMLWPWAVALAAAVLLAEWAVHHRRRE
jgi:Ca-activated chloride channel family protein